MIRTSRSCLMALLALSLAVSGCGNGNRDTMRVGLNDSKKRRSFAFWKRKSGKREETLERDGGDRQLAELRERERNQAKMVAEMREALSQGEDIVNREETKLQNIRTQLAMTGPASNNGDFGRQVYRGDGEREFSGYEERREYAQSGRDMPVRARSSRNRLIQETDGESAFYPEATVDGSRVPMMAPPASNNRRERYPEAERFPDGMDEADTWIPPGNLYQESGELIPPLPNRRQPSDSLFLAAPEARTRPIEDTAPRLPEKGAERFPAPDRRPVSAGAPPPIFYGGNSSEDDVFVPDLFLNGGH